MKQMDNEKYISSQGRYCPYCGSDELERTSIRVSEEYPDMLHQDVECLSCGRDYQNGFTLKFYV